MRLANCIPRRHTSELECPTWPKNSGVAPRALGRWTGIFLRLQHCPRHRFGDIGFRVVRRVRNGVVRSRPVRVSAQSIWLWWLWFSNTLQEITKLKSPDTHVTSRYQLWDVWLLCSVAFFFSFQVLNMSLPLGQHRRVVFTSTEGFVRSGLNCHKQFLKAVQAGVLDIAIQPCNWHWDDLWSMSPLLGVGGPPLKPPLQTL